jgi:hypothetical protein
VKAAEEPDNKDDRDRYADQPKQKTSTHGFLLLVIASQPNVGSELKFHGPNHPTVRLPTNVTKAANCSRLTSSKISNEPPAFARLNTT